MGERGAARVCRRGLDALIAVTLAPRCAACAAVLEAPLDGPVCAACWSAARAQTLPCLALPDDPAIDIGRAAADYEGTLRDIIHAFKYEGRRSLAVPLGAMMREAARDLCEGAGCDGASCVVPVPLHPWRRLQRGFNQAGDLARQLPLPVVDALWRLRMTPAQMTLTAAARRRNLRGAFVVAPWQRARIRGRSVLLIDDVATTGATLHACAAALRDAGAAAVSAAALARTPRHLERPARDRDRRRA